MKFKFKKFLTIFMLSSVFSQCVFGMEITTPHDGWDVVCGPHDTNENYKIQNFILFSKNDHFIVDHKYLDNIYQKNSSSHYCDICNLRIMDEKNAFDFYCKECKICLPCAVELSKDWNRMFYYRCKTHKLAILDVDDICKYNAGVKYSESQLKLDNLILMSNKNKSKEYKLALKDAEKKTKEAFEDYMKLYNKDYDQWGKKRKNKLRRHYEKNHADFDELEKIKDSCSIVSAQNMINLAFVNNEGATPECTVCLLNENPVCIPQCGHLICLGCLFEIKEKICSECRKPFSKILVLREGMDGDSCPKFIESYKKKIQDCIADK